MSDITIDLSLAAEAFEAVKNAHDIYFNGRVPSMILSYDLFLMLLAKQIINISEILSSKSNASFAAGCLFGAQECLMQGIDVHNIFTKKEHDDGQKRDH